VDAAGNRSTAMTATVTTPGVDDTQPPSTPGGLTGSATSSSVVNLSWTASTDNVRVAGYNVYRNGVQISQPVVQGDPNPPTAFTDEAASPSTTYTYEVSAVDTAGNVSPRASTTVTTPASQGADTTPPSTPGTPTATAAGPTRVDLSWPASTDNVGVTSYRVYRNGSTTPLANPTTTSYADTTVAASTTYTYAVTAVDAAGNESARSASASVTTPPAAGGGGTFTFAPTDDAYVNSSATTTNYGTATRLTVDNSPQNNTLLKFSVAGLPSGCRVTDARLRLTVGNATDDKSPYGGDLYGVADTTWTQSTVTWVNQPAAAASKISSVATAVALDTAYDWNATPLITGNGPVTMVVKSTSSDGARYYSTDGGTAAQDPVLTVVCG
jgi:hypothetical protein